MECSCTQGNLVLDIVVGEAPHTGLGYAPCVLDSFGNSTNLLATEKKKKKKSSLMIHKFDGEIYITSVLC